MMENTNETTELKTKIQEDVTVSYFQKITGILAILGNVIGMCVCLTSVQLLKRSIPDFELNALRYATAYMSLVVGFIITRKLPLRPKSEILITLCCGILVIVEALAIFVPATFISLSNAESIRVTSGIASGIILFSLFWEEKITLKRVIFALLCAIGVILVIQPEFISTGTQHIMKNCTNNHIMVIANETMETTSAAIATTECKDKGIAVVVLGYGLAILAGCSISGSTLLLKRNPYLGEHMFDALFWVYLLASTISAVIMAIFENPALPTNLYEFLLIAIHCITFTFAWPLWICGSKRISGNAINIVYSTCVVFVLIPQYTLLSSILPGNRNWIEVVGVVLVLLGSSLGSVLELLKSK